MPAGIAKSGVGTSCIIPTRNRAALLPRALASVMAQSVAVDEIVVVDDGSSDGTRAMLRRDWPAVVVVGERGVGPGRARHAGVERSRGAIVLFLDADDCWQDDHVQRLLTALRHHQVAYGVTLTHDTVTGDDFLIPEQGRGPAGECFTALLRWCFLVPSAVAVRREAYLAVGGFTAGHLAEDWHLFLRLGARYPFAFCGPPPITRRYLDAASICRRSSATELLHALSVLRTLEGNSPHQTKRIQQRFATLISWTTEYQPHYTTIQQWYQDLRRARLL